MNDEIKSEEQEKLIDDGNRNNEEINHYKSLTKCPYCSGSIVKRGVRKKKFEEVQIYFCKNCDKRFTSLITKHKTYPLKLIIDALTLYNKLNPMEKIPDIIKEKYSIAVTSRTISDWLKEFEQYTPFLRMREFASKKFSKKDAIEESKLFHQQIYNFKYHRAKLDLILNEEFRHFRFKPLQQFLELATAECPNHIFEKSEKRASEFKNTFNLDEVRIVPKDARTEFGNHSVGNAAVK